MVSKTASVREDLLSRLAAAAGAEVRDQAERSLERLAGRCARRRPEDLHVLLPFGGGKDSAYTLAYVRLMQLLQQARSGRTFQLHVLIMIHPGVPRGVFENVENVFRALGLPNPDTRVFATALHGKPIPLRFGSIERDQIEVFRQEVLISGHLAQGNGRETFCYSCNFVLMNAIARYVIDQRGEIDFVVTGDSAGEALGYWKWVQKTARRLGLRRIERERAGWAALFGKLSEVNDTYYRQLLGEPSLAPESAYSFPNVAERRDLHLPEYFGVFEETSYEFWSHDAFMRRFLGFELRDDSFNFTESDCRNPMLMAHLRGLLAEFEGRGYVRGVEEYLSVVTELMEQKSYNQEMIDRALAPYHGEAGILERRRQSEQYAWNQYRLTPLQLAGMVASPITDEGARLEAFLRWQYPEAAPGMADSIERYLAILRAELQAQPTLSDAEVEARAGEELLRQAGPAALQVARRFFHYDLGLLPGSLHRLVLRQAVSRPDSPTSALQLVRIGDPHQRTLPGPEQGANRILTGR